MISELQEKIKHGDKLRRAMHNTIQVRLVLVFYSEEVRPRYSHDRTGWYLNCVGVAWKCSSLCENAAIPAIGSL